MGKLIAFVGPPGGGKTAVAMKAAIETYCNTKSNRIFFLSPDLTVPSLGLLFPNYAPEDLNTLGMVIDNTDISIDNILKNVVTVKSMNDFGVLGFKSDENKYSFPDPTPEKLIDLFSVLKRLKQYIELLHAKFLTQILELILVLCFFTCLSHCLLSNTLVDILADDRINNFVK